MLPLEERGVKLPWSCCQQPSDEKPISYLRKGGFSLKKDNLLRYSMQLAFLKQLLEKKLISDREYSLIKSRLMKDYKIVSDLLS